MRAVGSRGARMALVALSMALWSGYLGWQELGCPPAGCEEDTLPIGGVLVAMIVGTAHLALLISLTVERGGVLARMFGVLLLLPTMYVAAWFAAAVLWSASPSTPHLEVVVLLVYGLAHLGQLWALAGIPIPSLQPVGGSHRAHRDTEGG